MLGFRPRPLQLRPQVRPARNDQQCVRREERAYRRAGRLDVAGGDLAIDGKNQRQLGVSRRSLGKQIEMTELGNLVAPELETHRLRHAEAVDVEYSPAHTELGDVFDHWDALEADRFEVRGEVFGSTGIAFSQLESGGRECARQLCSLEQCAAG